MTIKVDIKCYQSYVADYLKQRNRPDTDTIDQVGFVLSPNNYYGSNNRASFTYKSLTRSTYDLYSGE